MGRIADLLGEVAAAAEEGPEGLLLSPDEWDRLRSDDWRDEDIEDALNLVRDSLLQGELVDAADSLGSRLIELLGEFGGAASFASAQAGEGRFSLQTIGQLARRVARIEEILEVYRDAAAPDRKGFDALRRRLADHGIEAEMRGNAPAEGADDES